MSLTGTTYLGGGWYIRPFFIPASSEAITTEYKKKHIFAIVSRNGP